MEKQRSTSWQDIRKEYGMSQKVLNTKLKGIKKKLNDIAGCKTYRVLTPKQVRMIKEELGDPE